MAKFSENSLAKLATCHPDLIRLFSHVIQAYDCVVIEGHRTQAEQNEAFDKGTSEKQWPDGKHNRLPSLAVDVAPYPLNWTDYQKFYHFAGYVMGVAFLLGIKLRWGGDWDGDGNMRNQKLVDLPHFELLK